MSIKIAIIGNADSFWLQRFVDNVSVPLKQNVAIITATNTKYSDYYLEKGIQVITTKPKKKSFFGSRFAAIATTLNTVRAILRVKPDIIHIHYAYPYIMRVIPYLGKQSKKIITFWGSDLLRANTVETELINRASKKADALVVGAEDLYSKLIKIDKGFKQKTTLIRMGLTAFESIDAKRESANDCRVRLLGKQHEGKTVIAIGYNAGRAQQHLDVIRSLAELPDALKSKIVIVLPLTYQNEDKNYLEEIKKELENARISSVLLTEFMNDDQIADLCLSTDVFINAQTTDAISASMLEHIYAGTIIVNGEWLRYPFLDNNEIDYISFENLENLRNSIASLISENTIPYSFDKSIEVVKANFSWDSSRHMWREIYENLNNMRITN